MTAKMILNPYSARWESGKRRPLAEQALSQAGIEFETVESNGPGHCTALAAEAVAHGFDPIIAAGGDGTIGEVVNGLFKGAGDKKPPKFGVMPLGTANDLAHNVGLPLDLDAAAKVIAAGHTRALDVLQVNDRYFVNNSAVGFEPTVTVVQQNMKRVKGIVRYLLATFVVIGRNPKWHMRLEWDDGQYEGPCSLVTIGNSPLTGGIFYIAPHADPYDGKLTFVYGYLPTRMKILSVLPKIMKSGEGNYVEHPAVHEVHATRLRVHVEPTSPAHTDGELFTYGINDLEYSVDPGKLPLLIGS